MGRPAIPVCRECPAPDSVLPGIEALRPSIRMSPCFHRAAFFFRLCANAGNSPFKSQAIESLYLGRLEIPGIPPAENSECAMRALADILRGLDAPENEGLRELLHLGFAHQRRKDWPANVFATIMHKCLEALRAWAGQDDHPFCFLRPKEEPDPDFIWGCLESSVEPANRTVVIRPSQAPGSPAPAAARGASAALPAWLAPILAAPDHGRQDVATLSGAWASHVGPRYAGKRVNQDAAMVLAEPVAGTLHFALSDGVSSSTAAEIAARVVVQTFCETMARASVRPEPSTFEQAAHLAVEACLDRLEGLLEEARADNPRLKPLLGNLPPAEARRIFQNTLDRRIPSLGPALACTLVGGSLFPGPGGTARLFFIVVGDGVVECMGSRSDRVLFGMDPEEMVIDAAVCPGPIGRSLLQGSFSTIRAELRMGDRILVSSDGLQRGHASSLAALLRSRCGPGLAAALEEPRPLLDFLARQADEAYASPSGECLFADNLSLVVLGVEG